MLEKLLSVLNKARILLWVLIRIEIVWHNLLLSFLVPCINDYLS